MGYVIWYILLAEIFGGALAFLLVLAYWIAAK